MTAISLWVTLVRTEPDADLSPKATYSLSEPTDTSTLFLLKNNQPASDSDHRKMICYVVLTCSFPLGIKHHVKYKQCHLAWVKCYRILREGRKQFTSAVG